MPANGERSTFSTTWGAVLAIAGVAIGLGNIWRFPYTMGENGGAAFLFVYLLIVFGLGLPALMAELALGRHTRSGPLGAMKASRLPFGRGLGWLVVITVVFAVSLYNMIVGWVLYEVLASARGLFDASVRPDFTWLKSHLPVQFLCGAGAIGVSCLVLALGVKRGIERLSKILLPLFALLFILIIARVLTLDGAGAGVRRLFVPDWSDLTRETMLAAIGQAVFSLGLGGSVMVVYGSYLREIEHIPRTAIFTAMADVGAAVLGALVVVPAAAVFSVPLESGPPLMFEVMPEIFRQMPAGTLVGLGFFVGIFIVAMLSVMAAFEVVVGALDHAFGLSRRTALIIIFLSQTVLLIPLLLSEAYFAATDLVWIVTLLPVGSIVAVIALAWSIGRARALDELRRGGTKLVPDLLFYWIKYIVPIGIGLALVYGWIEKLTNPAT